MSMLMLIRKRECYSPAFLYLDVLTSIHLIKPGFFGCKYGIYTQFGEYIFECDILSTRVCFAPLYS